MVKIKKNLHFRFDDICILCKKYSMNKRKIDVKKQVLTPNNFNYNTKNENSIN